MAIKGVAAHVMSYHIRKVVRLMSDLVENVRGAAYPNFSAIPPRRPK